MFLSVAFLLQTADFIIKLLQASISAASNLYILHDSAYILLIECWERHLTCRKSCFSSSEGFTAAEAGFSAGQMPSRVSLQSIN